MSMAMMLVMLVLMIVMVVVVMLAADPVLDARDHDLDIIARNVTVTEGFRLAPFTDS